MLLWTFMFLLLVAGRSAARGAAARAFAPERCLVVGDQETIDAVTRKLSTSRVKAQVIGAVPLDQRYPTLAPGRFGEVIREQRIERVIIAPGRDRRGRTRST